MTIFMKRNDETTIETISRPLGKPGKGRCATSVQGEWTPPCFIKKIKRLSLLFYRKGFVSL